MQLISNPAAAIYGTITVGALLAAEGGQHDTYAETILALLLAMVMYWIAHAYSAYAGLRYEEGARVSLKGLGIALVHELPILGGAALPLVVLVGFGIGGAALGTAITAAVWTAAVVIAAIEVIAAVRADLRGGDLLIQSAIGIGLGTLVVVINALLRHH
jgi:hypothetical protein